MILVVDDNAAKRLSIISILEQLGHQTVEADSGEAALRAVMKQSFAAILLDVQMPGMNGYETAQLIRMRTQSEHTPIIFITAYAEDEADIPVAYATGAVDFIFAPIVPVGAAGEDHRLRRPVPEGARARAVARPCDDPARRVPRPRGTRPVGARQRGQRHRHDQRGGRDRVVQPRGDRALRLRGARGDRAALLDDRLAEGAGRSRRPRAGVHSRRCCCRTRAAARWRRSAAARTARPSRSSSS